MSGKLREDPLRSSDPAPRCRTKRNRERSGRTFKSMAPGIAIPTHWRRRRTTRDRTRPSSQTAKTESTFSSGFWSHVAVFPVSCSVRLRSSSFLLSVCDHSSAHILWAVGVDDVSAATNRLRHWCHLRCTGHHRFRSWSSGALLRSKGFLSVSRYSRCEAHESPPHCRN